MTKECLLIEDDQDDQEIFLMALSKIDHNLNCILSNNGVEGLKKLTDQSFIPAYIFLDINMPKMNGIECLQEIKKIERLKNSQVIIYSTSDDSEIVRQCKELGADHFLVKPAGFNPLVESLRNVLKVQHDG